MAFTFTSDPASSRRDRLRLMVGDIDSTDPLMQDASVDYYLSLSLTSDTTVAYLMCSAICGILARQISAAVGPLREEAQQKWEHYFRLTGMFYSLSQGGSPVPGVSGIGSAPPLINASDETVLPFFTRLFPR